MGKIQENGKRVVKEFFEERMYTTDRYGNMISPNGKYRIKFNKNKMRYERKVVTKEYGKNVTRWLRLKSTYWKDIKDHSDVWHAASDKH